MLIVMTVIRAGSADQSSAAPAPGTIASAAAVIACTGSASAKSEATNAPRIISQPAPTITPDEV